MTVSRRLHVSCVSTGLLVLLYVVYVNMTDVNVAREGFKVGKHSPVVNNDPVNWADINVVPEGFKAVKPWPFVTNEPVNRTETSIIRDDIKVGKPSPPITNEQNPRKLLYYKILKREWIKYFPYLVDMTFKAISEPEIKRTIAENVEVRLDSSHVLRMGETLGATIIAKDEHGTQQSHGGDFFWAILRPVNKSIDGVSCAVADNGDGTYGVKCILPFGGAAVLRVTMLHPSESVLEMMTKYSSSREYEVTMRTEMRNSANRLEYTDCSIDFPDRSPSELCNYTNPTHGERYTCLKPPSGECNPILRQTMKPHMDKLRFWDDRYFVVNSNYRVLAGVVKVDIATSSSVVKYPLAEAGWSSQPAEASGWFRDRKWVSRTVKVEDYSTGRLRECFRDKDVYFVGDSTVRQLYFYVANALGTGDGAEVPGEDWSRPRDSSLKTANITIHFRPPGPIFHNNGHIWPFLSDVLDSVTFGGKGTVIIITAGLHFELFSPDVFLDRITRIAEALRSLLRRLPGSKVIVKGLHYHEPRPPFVVSPWKTHLLDVIMRSVIRGVGGDVSYFEMWDFMQVRGNRLVHPEGDMVTDAVGALISYVC